MQFERIVGEVCLTFIITNMDDAFVLVTFFADATTSSNLTSFKIALGSYNGFIAVGAVNSLHAETVTPMVWRVRSGGHFIDNVF